MAKGYLISEELANKLKRIRPQSLNQGYQVNQGQPDNDDYFVKVTGKYEGSDFLNGEDNDNALYKGVEVCLDSAGEWTEVQNGILFGEDSLSYGVSPFYDLTHLNYIAEGRLGEEITIKQDTIVRVYRTGTDSGETRWVSIANERDFTQETAYNLDSGMIFDSEVDLKDTMPDSGWTTSDNNSGFVISVQTRAFYDEEEKKVYVYYRDFTYNAMGVITSVTRERREVLNENDSFWAKLTSSGATYDWVKLEDDAVTVTTTTGSDAVEVHGRDYIPTGEVVRMWVGGEDSDVVYRFVCHSATTGTPKNVTYSGEHQEAARSGVNWSRNAQGSGRGVKLTVITGVAYYDAGDEILYGYTQDLTFDGNGHLTDIGAEVRHIVAIPEICSTGSPSPSPSPGP